jgi:hypothetical protein
LNRSSKRTGLLYSFGQSAKGPPTNGISMVRCFIDESGFTVGRKASESPAKNAALLRRFYGNTGIARLSHDISLRVFIASMQGADNADSTGAVCGQLAGACWGESKIPATLRSGLARMDLLESALAGIVGQ